MIGSLVEVIRSMSERFADAGRELVAWPVRPGFAEPNILAVEATLALRLPPVFRETVSEWDFLEAEAGNVSMLAASTLEQWLVVPNLEPIEWPAVAWWTGANRPQHLLLIAQSDAHTILLNTDTDEIQATWVDDPDQSVHTIASTFQDFYRGLASIYLCGIGTEVAERLGAEVAGALGADSALPFWVRFAQGAA